MEKRAQILRIKRHFEREESSRPQLTVRALSSILQLRETLLEANHGSTENLFCAPDARFRKRT